MIDWHSHVLPAMDDGSHDVAESLALIGMQAAQGVDTVMATPHFYANDESVASFLARREHALSCLRTALTPGAPTVIPGAEVKYYPGISRMMDIKDLRIEGTKLLLLEMPMSVWSDYMVGDMLELSGRSGIQIVIAHVERYMSFQKSRIWDSLLGNGILLQANASFFTSLTTKRKALSLLDRGMIRFIGSDCHNLTARPPMLDKAFEVIRKKRGDEFLRQMDEYGHSLIATNTPYINTY